MITSCEKDQCWKCAWDAGYTKEMTVCDKTESEIVQYERDNLITLPSGDHVRMSCHSY